MALVKLEPIIVTVNTNLVSCLRQSWWHQSVPTQARTWNRAQKWKLWAIYRHDHNKTTISGPIQVTYTPCPTTHDYSSTPGCTFRYSDPRDDHRGYCRQFWTFPRPRRPAGTLTGWCWVCMRNPPARLVWRRSGAAPCRWHCRHRHCQHRYCPWGPRKPSAAAAAAASRQIPTLPLDLKPLLNQVFFLTWRLTAECWVCHNSVFLPDRCWWRHISPIYNPNLIIEGFLFYRWAGAAAALTCIEGVQRVYRVY